MEHVLGSHHIAVERLLTGPALLVLGPPLRLSRLIETVVLTLGKSRVTEARVPLGVWLSNLTWFSEDAAVDEVALSMPYYNMGHISWDL